jgi:hypothetical protein
MTKVKVKIEESQIRRAVKGQCNRCPNTVGILDVKNEHKLPWKNIRTTEQVIEFIDTLAKEKVEIPTPPRVATFVQMYDKGEVIDSKGNIKVRGITYTLHYDKDHAIRRPLRRSSPKYMRDKTLELKEALAIKSVPAPKSKKKGGTGSATKKRSPLEHRSYTTARRHKGIRGYEEHAAFLLSKPIDEPINA